MFSLRVGRPGLGLWRRWCAVGAIAGGKFGGKKDRMEKIYGRNVRPPGMELPVKPAPPLPEYFDPFLRKAGIVFPFEEDLARYLDAIGETQRNKAKFGFLSCMRVVALMTHFGRKTAQKQRMIMGHLSMRNPLGKKFWDNWFVQARLELLERGRRQLSMWDICAPLKAVQALLPGSAYAEEFWRFWFNECKEIDIRGMRTQAIISVFARINAVNGKLDGYRLVQHPEFVEVIAPKMQEYLMTRTKDLGWKEIPDLLGAFACAGVKLTPDLANAVTRNAITRLKSFPNKTYAYLPLWIARAFRKEEIPAQNSVFVSKYMTAVHAQMRRWDADQLLTWFTGCMRCGYELPSSNLLEWTMRMSPKVTNLSVTQQVLLIGCFADARIRPPKTLLQQWGPSIHARLPGLGSLELARVMQGLLTVYVRPEPYFLTDWLALTNVKLEKRVDAHTPMLQQVHDAVLERWKPELAAVAVP